MKITNKQFDKLIDRLKLSITDNGDIVNISFDNNYFAVEGSYDVLCDKLELEFFIEEDKSELTDEQVNRIMSVVESKVQHYKNRKFEDAEMIRSGEIGY